MAIVPIALLLSCATTASPGEKGPSSVAPVVEDLTRSGYPFASTPEQIRAFAQTEATPYLVGPGDVLRLRSGKNEFPDQELKVSPDGTINIANVGDMQVSRMDLSAIERAINDKLAKVFANVESSLVLVTALNKKVSLLGAVKTPGIVMLESDMSLIDVIAKAGGFESGPGETGLNIGRSRLLCRVIRENGSTVWIDLKAILFQNAINSNVQLRNNDILYVYRQ